MKFPQWLRIYGNIDYRGKAWPEASEQITFFAELRRRYPDLARIAIHPRNEGKRTMGQAILHKLEGLTPGASDIIIPGSMTFVCEMKRLNPALCRWEPHQLGYLKDCFDKGAFACVALGHTAALDAVDDWLRQVSPG